MVRRIGESNDLKILTHKSVPRITEHRTQDHGALSEKANDFVGGGRTQDHGALWGFAPPFSTGERGGSVVEPGEVLGLVLVGGSCQVEGWNLLRG
jgi:hypothetical protein